MITTAPGQPFRPGSRGRSPPAPRRASCASRARARRWPCARCIAAGAPPRPPGRPGTRSRTKRQAPMLRGSSWAHTISAPAGIPRQRTRELLARERVELLERARARRRSAPRFSRACTSVVVELARASAPRGARAARRPPVSSMTGWKLPFGQLLQLRDAARMAQQALRRHHHQRLLDRVAPVLAQEVEVGGGRRGIARRSMLSSAQSVRKRSRRALECSGPWPSCPCGSSSTRPVGCPHLVSDADQELVDDHLRAVEEVAELRLPHDRAPRGPPPRSRTRSPCTAASESRLSWTSKRAPPAATVCSGTYSLAVRMS